VSAAAIEPDPATVTVAVSPLAAADTTVPADEIVVTNDELDAGEGAALGLAAPPDPVIAGVGEEPPPPPPQAARNATRATAGQAIREKDNDFSSVSEQRPGWFLARVAIP